jgi:hypothetical protein
MSHRRDTERKGDSPQRHRGHREKRRFTTEAQRTQRKEAIHHRDIEDTEKMFSVVLSVSSVSLW